MVEFRYIIKISFMGREHTHAPSTLCALCAWFGLWHLLELGAQWVRKGPDSGLARTQRLDQYLGLRKGAGPSIRQQKSDQAG